MARLVGRVGALAVGGHHMSLGGQSTPGAKAATLGSSTPAHLSITAPRLRVPSPISRSSQSSLQSTATQDCPDATNTHTQHQPPPPHSSLLQPPAQPSIHTASTPPTITIVPPESDPQPRTAETAPESEAHGMQQSPAPLLPTQEEPRRRPRPCFRLPLWRQVAGTLVLILRWAGSVGLILVSSLLLNSLIQSKEQTSSTRLVTGFLLCLGGLDLVRASLGILSLWRKWWRMLGLTVVLGMVWLLSALLCSAYLAVFASQSEPESDPGMLGWYGSGLSGVYVLLAAGELYFLAPPLSAHFKSLSP